MYAYTADSICNKNSTKSTLISWIPNGLSDKYINLSVVFTTKEALDGCSETWRIFILSYLFTILIFLGQKISFYK